MHMGICLAAGLPWLEKFGISKPRKVLYIDKEMGERRTRWRSERLARGLGLNQRDLPFVAMVMPPFMADVEGPERLLATFAEREWQPDVIIIEGLRRILVGDENSSQDVAAYWANLNPITEAGITLITTHHMVKGVGGRKASGFDLVRGSGDMLAGVDIGLSVFRDFGDAPTTVIQDKARDDEEHVPFAVNVNFGPGRTDPVTLHFAGEDPEVSPSRTQQAAALVLQYLEGQPEKGAKRGDIDASLEKQRIPRRTVTRAIELLAEGSSIISPRRGYWQIAPEIEDNISPAA
jgi:AAA domain